MPGYPCISKMLVLVLGGSAMSCPSKAWCGVVYSMPSSARPTWWNHMWLLSYAILTFSKYYCARS